ncbi:MULTISPECIES: DUF3784 domain-containing protein [unclassified Exiguobacterium]|uniref:DUF3784 domain-containing protein n=1 Tax=unclassified Exiguobacterium TaxID=2644629 RepID=UPI00103E751C|nr:MULTISPECIES: DUF3784 domain-containing protein [unclassified Exiguobacterium]TCI39090.1 DUF3784 domain-containing protein [Exiguobacterium sp. SH4S7]TCI63123.1 DUF3784 domain-containing protein [Exiguobacterium sp. SH0S2]
MWILVFAALLMFVLGFAVHKLGWHFLISGYNTMNEADKARVDIKPVARLIGIMCYGIGFIFLIVGLIDWFGLVVPIEPLFIVLILFIVVILWRAQKYDGNIFDDTGRLRPGGKKKLIPIVLVSVLLLTVVPGLLLWFSQPTEVTLTDTALVIEGSYGQTVPYDEIVDVILTNVPDVERRTNGAATSSQLTGHFRTTYKEDVLLFINRDATAAIRIDWSGKPIYLNLETNEATEQLYEEVITR